MAQRLFLLYAVVELAVFIAMVTTVGFGWAVLAVLVAFLLGLVLAGAQVTRQLRELRSTLAGAAPPGRLGSPLGAATDSLMVAAGTVLVVAPGLASSVLGALLLAPPTRAVLRPAITAVAARRISRHLPLITVAGHRAGRPGYIDGEVIDAHVVEHVTDTVTDTDVAGTVIDADQPRLPRTD